MANADWLSVRLSNQRPGGSQVSDGTEMTLRDLSPDLVSDLDHKELVKLQQGCSPLSDGGNISQLLAEHLVIRDKVPQRGLSRSTRR